jgi:hypothetical protein
VCSEEDYALFLLAVAIKYQPDRSAKTNV